MLIGETNICWWFCSFHRRCIPYPQTTPSEFKPALLVIHTRHFFWTSLLIKLWKHKNTMYALQGSKNRATATTILSTKTPLPTAHTGLQLAKCGHQPSPFTTARPCQIPWAMKTTAMSASHTHNGGFYHIYVSNQWEWVGLNALVCDICLCFDQYSCWQT